MDEDIFIVFAKGAGKIPLRNVIRVANPIIRIREVLFINSRKSGEPGVPGYFGPT